MRNDDRDQTRRGFLTTLGATSIAGIAHGASLPLHARERESEYLFAPGLTYLNTGSLGPTPRAVLDRTLEAWRELESNPVYMAYGAGPSQVVADRARGKTITQVVQ